MIILCVSFAKLKRAQLKLHVLFLLGYVGIYIFISILNAY